MEFGCVGEEGADVLGAFHLAVGDLADVVSRSLMSAWEASGLGRSSRLSKGGAKVCVVGEVIARSSYHIRPPNPRARPLSQRRPLHNSRRPVGSRFRGNDVALG